MNIFDFEDKVIGNNLNAEAAFCNRVGDIFDQNHFNQKILFQSNYSRLLMTFFFFFEKGLNENTNQKLAWFVEEGYFLKKDLLKSSVGMLIIEHLIDHFLFLNIVGC